MIEFYNIEDSEQMSLQYFESRIQAGFPSPVQGSMGDAINLNRELVSNPAATFCARVIGDSMVDAGINDGDLLIIDRSLTATDGSIAVCFLDGDFTVKRVTLRDGRVFLTPANARYPEIAVSEDNDFTVWGVVKYIVKNMACNQ